MDPRARRAWQPLLYGAPAARVRAVLDELAGRLDAEVASPWLVDGAAGRALAFAYLDQAVPGQGHAERAERWLDRASELLAAQPASAGLFTGYAGVAWTVEHLAGGEGDEDACAPLDEALRDELAAPGPREHDLIEGLAGLGVYAIERLPRPSAGEQLARVVERLADQLDEGAWHTAPERLTEELRAAYPDGYRDLGVAHGAPAPIAVLAAACAAGVAPSRAGPALDAAWRWTMASRLPQETGVAFPYWRTAERPSGPARSAWCYGDPGAGRALYVAARARDDAARTGEALAIARRALDRPREATGCTEPGLCHGAAGLAHLANRMWQDTADPAFAAAARTWFEIAVAMPRPEDPSLLDGCGGLALALAAAIATREPAWDRLLLISVPPG